MVGAALWGGSFFVVEEALFSNLFFFSLTCVIIWVARTNHRRVSGSRPRESRERVTVAGDFLRGAKV